MLYDIKISNYIWCNWLDNLLLYYFHKIHASNYIEIKSNVSFFLRDCFRLPRPDDFPKKGPSPGWEPRKDTNLSLTNTRRRSFSLFEAKANHPGNKKSSRLWYPGNIPSQGSLLLELVRSYTDPNICYIPRLSMAFLSRLTLLPVTLFPNFVVASSN